VELTATRDALRGLAPKIASQKQAAKLARAEQKKAYANIPRGTYFKPPKFPWREIFFDDQHGIFYNPAMVEYVCGKEGGKDVGLSFFEVGTFDGLSRFRKAYKADTTTELKVIADGIIAPFLNNFGVVRMGNSNHGSRFIDWISSRSDNADINEVGALAWATLWENAIKDERLVRVPSASIQVGGFLMSHLRAYMRYGTSTVGRIANVCNANAPNNGLKPPFTIVAMGHTHRVSDNPMPGHRVRLWEVGAGLFPPEYALTSDKATAAAEYPMELGYGRVEWDKRGQIDPINSRVVRLGYSDLPAWARRKQ
jgi:hypothetical protein